MSSRFLGPHFENGCTRRTRLADMCVHKCSHGVLELRQSGCVWPPCTHPVQLQQVRMARLQDVCGNPMPETFWVEMGPENSRTAEPPTSCH